MKNISFTDEEFLLDTDAVSGSLRVIIPVDTVRRKMADCGPAPMPSGPAPMPSGPPPALLEPQRTRADIEADYADQLDGVDWRRFLDLNAKQTKTGKRSLSVVERTLKQLAELVQTYGRERVRDAVRRCREPRQANVAYIRAILKSDTRRGEHHHGKSDDIGNQIDAALQAL